MFFREYYSDKTNISLPDINFVFFFCFKLLFELTTERKGKEERKN